MITYDSLIEQAKSREMPPTKIRGILREYLQILILKELYRTEAGKRIFFTGGTYLRLIYNFRRFSEDLDFNTNTIAKEEFKNLLGKIKDGLKKVGIETQVRFAHWDNVYVSKLIFPKVERAYNVVSKYSKKEGIIIKVETYRAKRKIKSETHVISGFGELYPCICTDRGILFADKIDAFTKKSRGRHLYDIIFMLSNNFPIDKDFLAALGIEKGPLEVISAKTKGFSKVELKKQAEILRPFLFDEKEADLLVNAHDVLPPLLEKYKKSVFEK